MRAVEYDRFGSPDVLELRDVPSPAPRVGEVLVAVKAAALNPKDSFIRKGRFRRLTGSKFPRRLGFDLSGVVRALGPQVTSLTVGDEVFGALNGWQGGAVAEEVCVPATCLAKKPPGVSFEDAAALPIAALTGLQALRDEARAQPGQKVLLHGASGGVGGYAIQIARQLGLHVTTTSGAANLERCRELGAHDARDYAANPWRPDDAFDVFFDIFGNQGFSRAARVLGPRGTFVSTVPSVRVVLQQALSFLTSRRARLIVVRANTADLAQLGEWTRTGMLKPVIDRVLPLEQVREGQAHVETKRARGKVVIRVA
ncbi:MAG: NAD(P)-dependent alcohol dehydrogenase [Myxococcaceae bacterium]